MDFVLSDESVNAYGYCVLTSGIDLRRFLKNPVMLWMHNRGQVIGHWENVRKEKGKLLATPVFDEQDPFALSIKSKVESGILKGASIAIDVREVDPNTPMATSSELFEASIVDIPANANTIKLSAEIKKGQRLYFSINTPTKMDLRSQQVKLLGLPETAMDEQILQAMQQMQAALDQTQQSTLGALMDKKGLTKPQRESFFNLAKSDFNSVLSVVNAMPDYKPITEQLHVSITADVRNGKPRGEWTLNDYRKFAPNELKSDPELYKRLVAESKQK